jgi:spore coat protein U-like protein
MPALAPRTLRSCRQILGTVLIAYAVVDACRSAHAQNPLTITAPVSGQTVDGTLSFSGTASVNSITRRGTIRGQTNTGIECRGTTNVNLTLSRGEGTIVCGQLTSWFVFSLTRRQPPTGTGTGTLSDGRKVVLRIGQ